MLLVEALNISSGGGFVLLNYLIDNLRMVEETINIKQCI